MSLESANFISQLNENYPESTATASKSWEHINLWKKVQKQSWLNINSEVSANSFELNQLVGIRTQVQSQINSLNARILTASVSLDNDFRSASENLFVQLRNMSADLDLKIETLSSVLNTSIQALSQTYNTRILNLSGNLENSISTLSSNLNTTKLNLSATAAAADRWGNARQFFQTATPSNPVAGDLWFQL